MNEPSLKKVVYIYYCDFIDLARVKAIIGIVSQLIAQEKPNTLYFLLSSNGGDVSAGISLYNFLISLPVEITTHNIGSIDSIANVIFMAGSQRFANPHTTFHFHGVQVQFPGPISLTLPQVNEIRTRIEKDHKKIAGIICSNSKITEMEIKKLFAQGQAHDTTFVLKKGIIHDVKLAQIPQNALFVSINVND